MNVIDNAQNNGLDLSLIKPANGGKYSPNLYTWLTAPSRKHRAWTSRVFRDVDGMLFIGMIDDSFLIGSRLMAVLCEGRGEQSWAYPGAKDFTEVTDFWPRYTAMGRCAVDPGHVLYFVGDDDRWQTQGDRRHCTWCGNHKQQMRRWTEQIERTAWEKVQ